MNTIFFNILQVGHVDSGKSTLSGRLLHLLGRVTQKEMHKYEKEAKSLVKKKKKKKKKFCIFQSSST